MNDLVRFHPYVPLLQLYDLPHLHLAALSVDAHPFHAPPT